MLWQTSLTILDKSSFKNLLAIKLYSHYISFEDIVRNTAKFSHCRIRSEELEELTSSVQLRNRDDWGLEKVEEMVEVEDHVVEAVVTRLDLVCKDNRKNFLCKKLLRTRAVHCSRLVSSFVSPRMLTNSILSDFDVILKEGMEF